MPEKQSAGRSTRTMLTAEQVRAIAERIAAGERHSAVAQHFGVSEQTVRAIKSGKRWADAIDDDQRARMKVTSSGGTALDAAAARRVMAALEAGRLGRDIAEEFGISPSMVSAIKHGHAWAQLDPGLSSRLAEQPRQGKALTTEQAARIKRQIADGRSSRKIAEEFGVSASTVLAIARGDTWAEVEAAEA